ncbi:MAG: hypothetical protein ACOX2O_08685 [Bdellovibrionota bacterium]|jgi:hypothetical protein
MNPFTVMARYTIYTFKPRNPSAWGLYNNQTFDEGEILRHYDTLVIENDSEKGEKTTGEGGGKRF